MAHAEVVVRDDKLKVVVAGIGVSTTERASALSGAQRPTNYYLTQYFL